MSLLLCLAAASFTLELSGDTAGVEEAFQSAVESSGLLEREGKFEFTLYVESLDTLRSITLDTRFGNTHSRVVEKSQGPDIPLLKERLEALLAGLLEEMPPEPAPEPVADKGGILTVKSIPEGASVYIDGVYQGRTPLRITHLDPLQTYELRLTHKNREPYSKYFSLEGEGEMAYNVEMVYRSPVWELVGDRQTLLVAGCLVTLLYALALIAGN